MIVESLLAMAALVGAEPSATSLPPTAQLRDWANRDATAPQRGNDARPVRRVVWESLAPKRSDAQSRQNPNATEPSSTKVRMPPALPAPLRSALATNRPSDRTAASTPMTRLTPVGDETAAEGADGTPNDEPAMPDDAAVETLTDDDTTTPMDLESTTYLRTIDQSFEPWELARWYGDVDTLFLWRTNSDNVSLVRDPISGATVLESDAFDLPLKPGVQGLIGFRLDSSSAMEASYFWVADATDTIGVLNPTPGIASFDLDIKSQLWNFEANFLHSLRDGTDHPVRLAGFIGPRLIAFTETGTAHVGVGANVADRLNRVENLLAGGQVGIRGTVRELAPRLNLDFSGKLGLYGNEINKSARLGVNGSDLIFEAGGPSTFSQSLDGSVEIDYKIRPGMHLSAGYRLLYLAKVGRGFDQLDDDRPITANPDTSGDILFHGFTVGLEFYWGERTDPNCRSGCCTPYRVRTSCCD